MKRILSHIALSLGAVLLAMNMSAGEIRDNLKIRINNESGVYAKGEKVQVFVDAETVPQGEVIAKIYKNGVKKPVETKTLTFTQGENIIFEDTYDETVAMMIALTSPTDKKDILNIGWVVAPEGFTPGFEEPADLMSWWQDEIKNMRKLKMKADVKPVEMCEAKDADKYNAFSFEINCVGDKPARGYIVKPKDAAKKSLPIIIYVHSAGVNKPQNRSTVKAAYMDARRGNGAIAVDLNAHGMLNDQPQSYYDDLYTGEFKAYSTRMPVSRDNYYFKYMFLRLQRTIDYIVKDPAWDGKHIIVRGGSQGGAQGAFIASIDPRITAAALTVPAMIDQGGKLQGRRSTWPGVADKCKPGSEEGKVCAYFDPALMLKYSKAEFHIELGLFDETCPPANVYAGINQIKTAKAVYPVQRGHGSKSNPGYKKWHKQYDKLLNDFILEQMTK